MLQETLVVQREAFTVSKKKKASSCNGKFLLVNVIILFFIWRERIKWYDLGKKISN